MGIKIVQSFIDFVIVIIEQNCYTEYRTIIGIENWEVMQMLNFEINWALIAPLLVIQAILMIIALVDLIRTEKTNGPKWMWVLIVIFINTFGPILYFIIGKKRY